MKEEKFNEGTLNIYKKRIYDADVLIDRSIGKASNGEHVYETFFVDEPGAKNLFVIGHDLQTGDIKLRIHDTPADFPVETLKQLLSDIRTEYDKREELKRKALEQNRTL